MSLFPLLAAAVQIAAPAPARLPACTAPAYRAFDFWIGVWTVTNSADGTPAGHSVIEKLYDGCALRENWSEPGFVGGSLNAWVPADGHWHQSWTDSSGSWRDFVGGVEDGKMVLIWTHKGPADPSRTIRERMIFTPNPDGSVRQYSDQSIDGAAWTIRYDYTYRHPA